MPEDRPLWEALNDIFKAHPWHSVHIGENAPDIVTAYIEVVPSDTVKYQLDKEGPGSAATQTLDINAFDGRDEADEVIARSQTDYQSRSGQVEECLHLAVSGAVNGKKD